MVRSAALTLLCLVAQGAFSQTHQLAPPPREVMLPGFVKAGAKYYRPLTENALCNGFVRQAVAGGPNESQIVLLWSVFDPFALDANSADQNPAALPSELRLANVDTGAVTKLLDIPTGARVTEVFWGAGNVPVVLRMWSGESLDSYAFDVSSRRLSKLEVPTSNAFAPLYVPDSGLFVLPVARPGNNTFATFDSSGRVVATFDHPSRNGPRAIYGMRVLSGILVTPMYESWAVDPRTGNPVPVPPGADKPPPDTLLESWSPYRGDLVGLLQDPYPVMLNGRTDKGAVTSSVVTLGYWQTFVSSNNRYMCLYGPSGLRLTPIKEYSAEDYLAYKKDWVRQDAISRGKMIGIALQIYLADHDDKFPDSIGFKDSIGPYLKNLDQLEGFVYTLNGQLQTSLDMRGTVVGFIDTEYGRAILRPDSNVDWLPKGG